MVDDDDIYNTYKNKIIKFTLAIFFNKSQGPSWLSIARSWTAKIKINIHLKHVLYTNNADLQIQLKKHFNLHMQENFW